jgi:hypothetical protein
VRLAAFFDGDGHETPDPDLVDFGGIITYHAVKNDR